MTEAQIRGLRQGFRGWAFVSLGLWGFGVGIESIQQVVGAVVAVLGFILVIFFLWHSHRMTRYLRAIHSMRLHKLNDGRPPPPPNHPGWSPDD